MALSPSEVCGTYAQCIPLIRWGGVTGPLSNRSDGFLAGMSGTITSIPSQIAGSLLSFGNGLYKAAAQLIMFSTTASQNIVGKLGPAMNRFVGVLYDGVTGSFALFGAIFVAIALTGLYAVFRGQGTRVLVSKLTAFLIGIALCLGMGAMSSANPDTPAPGTPYWTVTSLQKITTGIGDPITQNIAKALEKSSTSGMLAKSASYDTMSCERYISTESGLMYYADETAKASNETVNATVRMLNTMWEESGLRTWGNVQFAGTGFMPLLFCRPLEAAANIEGEKMATIVKHTTGNAANFNGLAPAFNPTAIAANKPGEDKAEGGIDSTKSRDRYMMMWMTCTMPKGKDTAEATGNWGWRYGMRFLNLISGDDRKGIGDVNAKGAPTKEQVCSAAFTGSNDKHPSGFLITLPSKQDEANNDDKCADNQMLVGKSCVDASAANVSAADRDTNLRRLGSKFDLPETGWKISLKGTSDESQKAEDYNWKYMIAANNTRNQSKNAETQKTIAALHGSYEGSDIFAAFMLVIAGLVNFVIWGLLLSFVLVFGTAAALLIAGPGLIGGFLIYAVAPERGKKALQNTMLQLVAMCATSTVVSLIATLVALLTISLMAAMSSQIKGDTSPVITALEAIICPLGSIALLRYLCIKVWKVGDPMSMAGLGAIASGKAVMGKFGKAAKGIAAGAIGGFAALKMGGSIASAARSAVNGAKDGTLSGAAVRGMNAGFADKLEQKKLAALEGRGGGAATTPATNQAEKAVAEGKEDKGTPTEAAEEKSPNTADDLKPIMTDLGDGEPEKTKEPKKSVYDERLERLRNGEELSKKERRGLYLHAAGRIAGNSARKAARFALRHPTVAVAAGTVLTGGLAGVALPLLPAMGATYGATKVGGKAFRAGKQLYENRTISRAAVQAKNLASEAFKKTTIGQIHQAKQEGVAKNQEDWRNQHFGTQSEFSEFLRGSESKDAKEAARRKQEEEQHKEQS